MDSQIKNGFEALTNNLMSFLDPPLLDPSQAPLKLSLDKAFETLRERFAEHLGESVECSDEEMINVIQSTFAPCKTETIYSVDKALEYLYCGIKYKYHNDVERLSKNQWVIKNPEAFEEISYKLSMRYRTLK